MQENSITSHGIAPGADTVSVAGYVNPTNTTRVANNSRNGRSTDALTATCTRARGIFNKQLTQFQNIETKRECLKEAANLKYSDPIRCYADLITKAERLLDSMRFNDECKQKNLDPKNVAQHVVFEGAIQFRKVQERGVREILGERMTLFGDPLITPEMLSTVQKQQN